MMHQLLPTIGLVVSGGIGFLSIGVAIFAFKQYRTTYRRVLLPLTVSLTVFTLAHWFALIWPSHPILTDLLEPLAYTGLLFVVYEFATIHPQISQNTGSDML